VGTDFFSLSVCFVPPWREFRSETELLGTGFHLHRGLSPLIPCALDQAWSTGFSRRKPSRS
jgi:hypothetical protein